MRRRISHFDPTSALVLLAIAGPAAAHEPFGPAMLSAWGPWDAAAAALLATSAALYVRGVSRLWRRAPRGRAIAAWRAAAFGGGWLTLFVAQFSAFDSLAEILFSAHMAQHEVLMLVAAPLLVLGQPLIALLWALPLRARVTVASWSRGRAARATWRRLTGPFAVWVLHMVVLSLWHVPPLFDAALAHEGLHLVQHGSFLLTATLFWWAMIAGRYGRRGYGLAVLYVFATAMYRTILGALLTFSSAPWYPLQADRATVWAVAPLEDQQAAGLLMWVPFGTVLVLIALALFAAWIGQSEGHASPTRPPLATAEGER